MKAGDLLETKNVVVVSGEQGPRKAPALSATFAPPKEYRFELLFLGMRRLGEKFDPAAALNALGWVMPAEDRTIKELDAVHKLLWDALRDPAVRFDNVRAALAGVEKLYEIFYLKLPEEPHGNEIHRSHQPPA